MPNFVPCSRSKIATLVIGLASAALGFVPGVRAQQAQTEIVYSTFLDPNNTRDPRAAAQTRMLEAFAKANPEIRVKLLVDPTVQVVARAMKAHDATPDVLRTTGFSVPEFVATGAMQPLDELMARDKISMDDWLLPLSDNRVSERLYSLPQDFRIPILFYRKSLLQQANVTPPRTWDEICAEGPKLATLKNVIGFAVPVGATGGLGGAQGLGEYFLSSMITEDTGQYFAPDGKMAFSKEAFIRTATTLNEMFGKCGSTPKQSLQLGINEVHDGLRAGKIAMTVFGLYRYKSIQEQGAGDDLAWAPPPAYSPEGKQAVYGYQIALNAFSQHKDEAWKLIKFMTSPEAQAIAAEGGEVVSRASAYTAPYFKSPQAADQIKWAELIKSRGRVVGYTPILTTFHQIVGDAIQRMVLSNRSPESAYEEVVTRYNDALAKTR